MSLWEICGGRKYRDAWVEDGVSKLVCNSTAETGVEFVKLCIFNIY